MPEPRNQTMWPTLNRTLRPVALLGMASLVSGIVVGGIGGRLAMSITARAAGNDLAGRLTENGNVVGEFTLGGTIALVVFVGLLGGMFASVVIVASEPWLRWMGPLRGIGFGVVVLAVFGYDVLASIDFLIFEPVLLNVTMFLSLFVGLGLGVVGFERLLDRRLPDATDYEQLGWPIIVGLGAIPMFVSLLFFTSSSFCGCEPAYEIGVSLLVMVLSTFVYLGSKATSVIPASVERIAIFTGYASVAAAVLFGTLRIIENLQQVF